MSSTNSILDKENSDAAALKIAALEKSLKNARAKAKQAEKNAPGISLFFFADFEVAEWFTAVLNDNELESEEKSDDDAGINFTSSGSVRMSLNTLSPSHCS